MSGTHDVAPFQLDAYDVLTLLGKGGMGEVWLARDLALERKVALKAAHAARATGSAGAGQRADQPRPHTRLSPSHGTTNGGRGRGAPDDRDQRPRPHIRPCAARREP